MSMTPRENAMAIFEGRQPDRYVDMMHAIALVPDPVFVADDPPQDGLEHKDTWGTVHISRPGEPGQMPIVNDKNAVIRDITRWSEQLVVPDLDHLDWSQAQAFVDAVPRDEKFVGFFCAAGLFERAHYLMGFEKTLVNFMVYPDQMQALLRVVADYKIKLIRLAAEKLHPDVIFYHDDWGSKQSLFLPPDLWRRIIKPLHTEIAQTAHECGMLFLHHADCFCQPLVEDMVDMGIDIWQGSIPQNDIVKIQQITGGKLSMIGGVDGPKIDVERITEEEIRAEVRRAIDTYCPGGRFFPSIANGVCFREWNNEIYMDELYRYGEAWAKAHPIA